MSSFPLPRVLRVGADPLNASSARSAASALSKALGAGPMRVKFVPAKGVGGVTPADIEIQAVQVNGEAIKNAVFIQVWCSSTKVGAPDGTQTFVVPAVNVVATYSANRSFLMATDSAGLLKFTLAIGASGTRYIRTQVGGAEPQTQEVTFS